MKEIKLNGGETVLVDDEDFPYLNQFHWRIYPLPLSKKLNYGYPGTNVMVGTRQRTLLLHRLVMGCRFGDGKMVDHKDGNTLDARKQNLRFCTPNQNSSNQRPGQKRTNKSSRFHGVCWQSKCKKWLAQIMDNRKQCYLGLFTNEEAAARAYDAAAKVRHGEFASLNFA